jgi:hypothetical protein
MQQTMPKVPISTHRIQRHFSPLLYRTPFSPERLLTPPPLPYHVAFPLTEGPVPPPSEDCHISLAAEHSRSSCDSESEQSYPVKIPKPRGEVARPKRHGYRLRDVVKWDEKTYNRVQVSTLPSLSRLFHIFLFPLQTYINELAKIHLCLESTFSKQLQPDLEVVYAAVSVVLVLLSAPDKVCIKAVREFPFLDEFQGLWVVQDFLKTHLKYTSEQLRKKQGKIAPNVRRYLVLSSVISITNLANIEAD